MQNNIAEYKDNRKELKQRLKADYNLPNDPVVEAMLEATVVITNRGCAESEPIHKKYQELLCPWCGHLHYKKSCQEKYVEYVEPYKK